MGAGPGPSPDLGGPPQSDGSGPGADTQAPQVQITEPTANATVPTNTKVKVKVVDNGTIARVELLVDGAIAASSTADPYEFSVVLKPGTHLVKAVAYDSANNKGEASVMVTVLGGSTPPPTDPAPTDPAPTDPAPTDPAPTDPAPNPPETKGPFGSVCEAPGDCSSGLCVRDPNAQAAYCTERCSATDACPTGGTCLDAGPAGQLCALTQPNSPSNPGDPPGTEIGGCAVSSSTNRFAALPVVLLAFGLFALVRRRG